MLYAKQLESYLEFNDLTAVLLTFLIFRPFIILDFLNKIMQVRALRLEKSWLLYPGFMKIVDFSLKCFSNIYLAYL